MIFSIFKGPELATEISGNQFEDTKYIIQNKQESNEEIIDLNNFINNSANDISKTENVEFCNIIGSQREESNAFQLLMNRDKPIQYKLLPQESMEDIKYKEKLDNIKELRAKHKEKIIALADKKGYSKKKIAEMEESERIEKNIENRMRFFKSNIADDSTPKRDDNIGFSIKNNKQSGNLLDYFR